MGQSQAAAGLDRLPWLPDDPAPSVKRGASGLVAAAIALALALLVVAAAFWFGSRAGQLPPASQPSRSGTTVPLPPAQPQQSTQPQVKLERAPEVEPIVAPPMPIIEAPAPVRRPLVKATTAVQPTDEVKDSEQSAAPKAAPLEPWPVRVIDGASGRLVRIGAFATPRQAKKGWWAIVKMNPALKRLPALVVPVRSLRNGRTYYRLQMGTTSQAHSEVLCQRMRMIAQGCVVIGVEGNAEPAK